MNCDPCNPAASVTPPACNCPPSPIPPWARQSQLNSVQTLIGNGTVSLKAGVTILDAPASEGPFAIVIPNGNFIGQEKRILVLDENVTLNDSATFTLSGNFSGFSTLKFDALGYNAVLIWLGNSWQLFAGNATQQP